MSEPFDDFKNSWQDARRTESSQPTDTDQIIRIANLKMKRTTNQQLGTVLILLITAVGLSAFFMYVTKFTQPISHVGVGLMVGGLTLRILIELGSIYLSTTIDLGETALRTTKATSTYYQFRKRINGPVTIAILVLYTAGFFMLTPEFSLYFSTRVMILIDLSYIPAAIVFTWFIRNTIKKEMTSLREILRIQQDITGEGV